MTHQEAREQRFINRIKNVFAEMEADLKVAHIQKQIEAYKAGLITADEFNKLVVYRQLHNKLIRSIPRDDCQDTLRAN